MGETLRIILFIVPLIAGAIAIFFAFQLMKRYDVPFADSYYYYLVFLYIFGTYSLAGSGILEYLLTRMEIELWVFIGFMVTMYLVIFAVAILFSRKMSDHYEKKFIRVFCSWYLLYMALSCSAFALIHLHEIVPHIFIFIFIFLSWHLIPILFFNLYLEKYHGQSSSLQEDFETKLASFSAKFEISKREREVIQLICKGQSNQEIGDAFFISLQTVKDHIHRIFVKSGVKNRVQLTNMIRSGN